MLKALLNKAFNIKIKAASVLNRVRQAEIKPPNQKFLVSPIF